MARAAPPVIADAQLSVRTDAIEVTDDLSVICVATKQLVVRAARCAPRSRQMLDDTLRSLERDLPADTPLSARERQAAICAGIAKAFDDQLVDTDPACRLTVGERTRNDAFLASYYGRRTTPRPTSDSTVDKNLAALAAARDVLCACTDEECVRAIARS